MFIKKWSPFRVQGIFIISPPPTKSISLPLSTYLIPLKRSPPTPNFSLDFCTTQASLGSVLTQDKTKFYWTFSFLKTLISIFCSETEAHMLSIYRTYVMRTQYKAFYFWASGEGNAWNTDEGLTFHCSKVLTRCSFSNSCLRPGLMFLDRRDAL